MSFAINLNCSQSDFEGKWFFCFFRLLQFNFNLDDKIQMFIVSMFFFSVAFFCSSMDIWPCFLRQFTIKTVSYTVFSTVPVTVMWVTWTLKVHIRVCDHLWRWWALFWYMSHCIVFILYSTSTTVWTHVSTTKSGTMWGWCYCR